MKGLLKTLYELIPFKAGLFRLLRTFWKPPESIYKHLHFKGTIEIPVSKKEKFKMKHYGYVIENDVFWTGLTGGWEKKSLELWTSLSRRSKTILDIGANTGIYSLISKCVNPAAEVYALEPIKRVFLKLQNNVRLNDYSIHTIEKAASDQTGTAVVYDTNDEHTYAVTVNENRNEADIKVTKVQINTITLDDLIKEMNIDKVDLIKLDVETHEAEVLAGYLKHIYLHRPIILIEILNDAVGEKVEKIVAPLNYLYYNIGESKGIRLSKRITQSDHYNYLLCDKETAISLQLPVE